MKKSDFSLIYNIPEDISGAGCGAHFIGFCLLPAIIILVVIPVMSIDPNFLKDFIELIISSGFFVTLGIVFIFILCPLYFLIRCIMEMFRTIKSRREFYSTPNIEYIKLNDEDIFFKNTCKNCNITIKKSDVESVLLDGNVNTFNNPVGKGSSRQTTYVENLKMTIKTTKGEFIIYPQIKLKQVKGLRFDYINLLKQQIQFYKNYFDNFNINIDSKGTDTIAKLQSNIIAYELETGNSKKSVDYLNIILNIILVIVFIYFFIYFILTMFFL
jgi:hypothetical protein